MAQVTVELRNLLRTDFELFDFEYQFDDPIFKKKLEQAVIDFYWNYEIGQETPDEFKRRFKARWLRLIDYYNKLYNTTLLEYNPLTNYSMTEALDQLSTNTAQTDSSGNSTATSEGEGSTSDYPQQPIAGGDYLAGATSNNSTTTTEDSGKSTASGSSNMNYTKTIEGITGVTYQELITQQRQTLLRISNMVIDELKPCFLLIY